MSLADKFHGPMQRPFGTSGMDLGRRLFKDCLFSPLP